MRTVMWRDKSGRRRLIRVPKEDEDSEDLTAQKLDAVTSEEDEIKHVFSEEELLIASPVVLGFSFSEKLWLEFSLAGISEIKWQTEAFESLVLPAQIKQNLKGLVSSHRFNAAKTIDDVIVGKGKGLNVVLHGPPGVGKTLTGESIAEFLRCPLYMVSSGELGTSAKQLEHDLNRIMEITHAWGAILLLDEADVFLEARQPHDIHRNALVSVFLRLTEYYQGILFLTTNRVATFDEAFQSRIHMGIRYEQLTVQARKKIWMHYVGKVLAMDEGEGKTRAFADSDFDELSRKVMNGRQVRTFCFSLHTRRLAAVGGLAGHTVLTVVDVLAGGWRKHNRTASCKMLATEANCAADSSHYVPDPAAEDAQHIPLLFTIQVLQLTPSTDQERRQNQPVHRHRRKRRLRHGLRQARHGVPRDLRGRHERRPRVPRLNAALHLRRLTRPSLAMRAS